jgi:hypothetical protein
MGFESELWTASKGQGALTMHNLTNSTHDISWMRPGDGVVAVYKIDTCLMADV